MGGLTELLPAEELLSLLMVSILMLTSSSFPSLDMILALALLHDEQTRTGVFATCKTWIWIVFDDSAHRFCSSQIGKTS